MDEKEIRQRKHKRRMRMLRDTILRLLLLALVVYILVFHLIGLTIMPSGDMYPRLDAGDLVVYYRLENDIRAQDIVVFEKPASALVLPSDEVDEVDDADAAAPAAVAAADAAEETGFIPTIRRWFKAAYLWLGFKDPNAEPTQMFICRVVATPGDTVEISDGARLVVNGNTMIESGIFYSTPEYVGFVDYPLTLGEDEYFVLADYRNGGADSRFFGAVRRDEILGTVITIMRRNKL